MAAERVLWTVLTLSLTVWSSATAQESVTAALDPLELDLQANANCCPLSVGGSCIEEDCPASEGLLNSADGDALTEWVVDFVSDESPNGPRAEISFDFGQIYTVTSVTLLSTTELLPRNWSLIFSANGTISEQIFELTNEGTYEQVFSPTEEGETELQASRLQLLVNLPTPSSPLPVSIAEVIITVTGEGLAEEQGCGVCVEDLTDNLEELLVIIQNSSESLPSVNRTQEDLLRREIMEAQISVEEYEDILLVLSVVFGFQPPLDNDTDISPNVPRLDLVLVPSIPTKLDQLRELLDTIERLDISTDDLEALLNQLEPSLGILLSNVTDLMTVAASRRDNFTQLVTALGEELNATEEALVEATVTLELITSRNFSTEMDQLQEYQEIASSALNLATSLWDTITAINEEVMTIESSLDGIGSLLREALEIAVSVSSTSRDALENVETVDEIIEQIQELLSEAAALDAELSEAILNVTFILNDTLESLRLANDSLQNSSALLPNLDDLISMLREDVERFVLLLTPYRLPASCDPDLACTENELHAEILSVNSSIIVGSPETIYTLMRAEEVLENIGESGQLFNYSAIIAIAHLAQQISNDTLDELSTVNTTALQLEALDVLSETEELSQRAQELATAVNDTTARAEDLEEIRDRLFIELVDLQEGVESARNDTTSLRERTGLEEEAMGLFQLVGDAFDRASSTDQTVVGIEDLLPDVAGSIQQTRANVEEAEEALDVAEEKFPSIAVFLNATLERASDLVFNVTSFIAENDRIISEIDDIISGLADIHSRVSKINSPVQLLDSEEEQSYLSLQPPPGRVINNTIQFETLDLYFWTGSAFRVPSLLFYAGPVYREGADDINATRDGELEEDYFLVTVELGNMLQLQWNMRGTEGSFIAPGFSLGFSEIYITRHGSEFEVRYGVSVGGLGPSQAMGSVSNNSLLFSTSNRTAFLVGGWPSGAQLGLPGSSIDLMRYNTFQGQLQLLLFNGEQWGLWNIRGASATEFIGSFQRSEVASANTWTAPTGALTPSSVISFDGAGYLFVEQFSDIDDFVQNLRSIVVITRPNEESDGLVMYAYDEELFLSMELGYSQGSLRLIIRRHDTGTVLVDFTEEPDRTIIDQTPSNGRRITITFFDEFGYRINNDNDEIFSDNQNEQIFFTNLARVKVWYGGVDTTLLESPFIPELNTAGYCGCIHIEVQDDATSNIFMGSHFVDFYLESPILKGFAATCLTSIYARDVSFDGTPDSFLSYSYLVLVRPTNHPPGGSVDRSSAGGARLLSFTLLTVQSGGVVLVALTQESYLAVILNDMMLEVHLGSRDGATELVLESIEPLTSQEQEYVLIELSPASYSLYLNGVLQSSVPAVPGLPFDLITNPADTTEDPVLYIGGVPNDLGIAAIPQGDTFMGCLQDLAFNFSAMSFLNTALPPLQRYPSGVSYHACPFLNLTLDPLLAVHPDNPTGRVCLGDDPAEVANTHGGFHRQTSLTTSNVIDLIASSWTISMSLRRINDGHVMTLRSAEGHAIRLALQGGQVVLSLTEPVISGSGSGGGLVPSQGGGEMEVVGPAVTEGVFTTIAIGCEVDTNVLTCSLSVAGVTVPQTVQAAHISPIFFPQLPLEFGSIAEEMEQRDSFIGCIADLATNGNTQGFSDVQTDTQCFNRTQPGYGFSGLSHLSLILPELTAADDTQNIFIIFQPQLDNGLVFTLTDENATTALLAVGMFNGELRLSNFSGDSVTLRESVCEPLNPSFYNLSLTFSPTEVEATLRVAGEEDVTSEAVPLIRGQERLLATVGNIPPELAIAEDSDMFDFLLSEELVRHFPPGLFGCVSIVVVEGDQISLSDAVGMEQLLVGFCPVA